MNNVKFEERKYEKKYPIQIIYKTHAIAIPRKGKAYRNFMSQLIKKAKTFEMNFLKIPLKRKYGTEEYQSLPNLDFELLIWAWS